MKLFDGEEVLRALDDVRTRFESCDPEFMAIIANIRKINTMVEYMEAHPIQVFCQIL